MIQVERLRKSFGPVQAVRDISFTAPDGAITGLLGENGAGKTTTFGLICGLIRADEGAIRVGPGDSTPLERRRRLGALLDHKGLYERLTARENIAYFGRLQGIPRGALSARVQDVLVQLGLERVADRRTEGFSQGERMKVALGRALVHGPAHLLLDEPTNGLDIPGVHASRRPSTDAGRGACLIFSSHVLSEVRALCDNVVIISRGRVVANGAAAEICRQAHTATLEDAFLTLTGHEELAS